MSLNSVRHIDPRILYNNEIFDKKYKINLLNVTIKYSIKLKLKDQ